MSITIFEDPEQDAVLADDGPRLLITSPPGSGKTFTALRLAARDIAAGRVSPARRMLLLTFSRAARAQLERYAHDLLSVEDRCCIEITNYHSFFWNKVSQFRQALGLPLDLEIATSEQHRQDVLSAMIRAGLSAPTGRRRENALRDYSPALEYMLDVGLPERFEGAAPELLDAVAEALRLLHIEGRIHYDDMAFYMWRLADESATLRQIWSWKHPVIVLDEYQDASPLQAAIVRRMAPTPHRVYAFADPLQMIYGWRDASPRRLDEFRDDGASEHTLRTLHRYRSQPALQAWMEQVRDVLLGDRERVDIARPAEVEVIEYDPAAPERGRAYGAASRELWQLRDPISRAFGDGLRSIGVFARRRNQIPVLMNALTQTFRCSLLGDADEAADLVREWMSGYSSAVTAEHHAARLLDIAETVAPRHPLLADLRGRLCPNGIRTDRLHAERRALADRLNTLARECETLPTALGAAREATRVAISGQDPRVVAWERERTLRRVMRALPGSTDAEARQQVDARILQLRTASEGAPERGLFVLTCHEGKAKEFDLAVLPWLTTENFGDDDESRQLLYVSLTRGRKRIIVRVARGEVPPICELIGLV